MPRRYEDCLNDNTCSRRGTTRCDNCKKRHADYMREYSRVNAERINSQRRARWHTKQYGLTDAERSELFRSSDGLCALCYEIPATMIDHDHETGKVRGALCHTCNSGLGFIEKMGATDARAITEYLTTDWRVA